MIAFNSDISAGYAKISRSPIVIREFSLSDLPFWAELSSDAVTLRHFPGLRHSSIHQLADYLSAHNSFTAFQDDIPVGGIFLSILPQSNDSVVVDIVTHPDLRSSSVASRILRELPALVRSYGASTIRAILTPDNQTSLRAFERAGFNKIILLEKTI
jgi:RimJ/RimL family protein N-acetyltransferase